MSLKSLLFAIFLLCCSISQNQVESLKMNAKISLNIAAASLDVQAPPSLIPVGATSCGKRLAYDPKNPPMCTKEYFPVCANGQPIVCVKAPCIQPQKTYGNKCEACTAVDGAGNYINDYYFEGKCVEEPVLPKGAVSCDPRMEFVSGIQIDCTKELMEVCGYSHPVQCFNPPCTVPHQTYHNKCMACYANDGNGWTNDYYIPGSCDPTPPLPEGAVSCEGRSPFNAGLAIDCIRTADPVCGYEPPVQCIQAPCIPPHDDYRNGCMACYAYNENQDGYKNDFYIPGACPVIKGPPVITVPEGAVSCGVRAPYDPKNPKLCAKIYKPVCGEGHVIKCIKAPCTQDYGNECEACNAVNEAGEYLADYYYPGKCSSGDVVVANPDFSC